jgi:TDG/mug DNA glycosylase family protein
MLLLPDILAPDLSVVFCGLAVGECAALRGHHYSGRGDRFWHLLYEAGFTPHLLSAADDATLPEYGYGLTNVVRGAARSSSRGLDPSGVPELAGRLEPYAPRWVACTGKTAGSEAAALFGRRLSHLGRQDWTIGTASVFVLPSPSSANQRRSYDGRPTRLEWWRELAEMVAESRQSVA